MKLIDKVGWLGTSLTLTGVAMQALLPMTLVWSYPVFMVAACLWLVNAAMERNRPHILLQSVLLALNAIATVRYLIL